MAGLDLPVGPCLLGSGRPGSARTAGRAEETPFGAPATVAMMATFRVLRATNAAESAFSSRSYPTREHPPLRGPSTPSGTGMTAKKRRKPAQTKRRRKQGGSRIRPAAAARGSSAPQLRRERDEALEQQAATSEILSVISRSPGDVQPVLDTIVRAAVRLCDSYDAVILLRDGDRLRIAAHHGPMRIDFTSLLISRDWISGRVVVDRVPIHVRDVIAAGDEFPLGRDIGVRLKQRTCLGLPLLRHGKAIGCLFLRRTVVQAYTDRQIALLQTFADQAVIAIENARLFEAEQQRARELAESLEQQTATSEVLKTISRSPGELTPVFEAMLENATRLCEAQMGELWLFEDADAPRIVATRGSPSEWVEFCRRHPDVRPGPMTLVGRVRRTRQTIHVTDTKADVPAAADPFRAAFARIVGARTLLAVPMLKDDALIGIIVIYRMQQRPFGVKQIELVENFAAQAVIAIENARLLSELRQRTDDLTESLDQQTATSDVLRVISSSTGDLAPVFEAMLQNAVRICGAQFGNLLLREQDTFRIGATHGAPAAYVDFVRREGPFRIDPRLGLGRMLETKQTYQVADIAAAPTHDDKLRIATIELAGARTVLGVPMLKDDDMVGSIIIYRREVREFTDKQIELVENFAAQAVIAIENARLLSELRESLDQQTATADVLRIISASPGDLQPVFDAMLENAVRICDSRFGILFRYQADHFEPMAQYGLPPAYAQFDRKRGPFIPNPGTILERLVQTRQTVHIADDAAVPHPSTAARLGGARSIVSVPMFREDELVGAINIYRQEVRPFNDKQIELVQSFAAQAVIAIENTRLLSELRESLQQQTATAEVLGVISSSTGELEPVFNAMLENATRICGAKFGAMYFREGDEFRAVAMYGAPQAYAEAGLHKLRRPGPNSGLGRVARTKDVVQIEDVAADQGYTARDPLRVAAVELGGVRTLLAVPLLKDDEVIGTIAIYRQVVQPFTDKQVALVRNFASQAVIAIENTRLLSELRESLQQQTATADVLKAISRSAFDLLTVLDALLQSAARLCDADQGTITQRKGDAFFRTVSYGFSPAFLDYVKDVPVEPGRETGTGRALAEGKVIHIADVLADPDYTWSGAQKLGGFRTLLGVPMLRDGVSVGVLTLTRTAVRPFTDKQIELVSTFADQAAIAIENVRLFEAEQQRRRELAKSLEDLRAAQDRLVQTEKLASLGQLTAGIAHEIKNPLNFVNNFSGVSVELIDELKEALQRVTADQTTRADIVELSDTLRDNLHKIVQHGKRADSIVKNMLLHSRQGSGERRPTDINALVEESLNLAYHGARAEKQGFNITLQRSFDPAAGEVDVFPQEITRALLNLIGNGFYAATKRQASTGDGCEPTLAAATKNLGDRVEISIRDNGTGIPPEVKEKMFNPFFTTKPAGEGTGLGLSLSHDIVVKQHSGSIEVETEPGAFTEFRIILPRTAAKLAAQ